jgi:nucleotide-binding universal stress UspA family protein
MTFAAEPIRASQDPASMEIRRVLLATDLSPTSELATDWAFDLARRNDAALLVVSVIDPRELVLPTGAFRTRVDQVRDRREAAAQGLVERGRQIGVTVRFLVWTGEPGESIVAAAEAEEIDLILVGAHTRGSIGRFLMGSVSEYVARHAPCPVLIVREAARGRPASLGAAWSSRLRVGVDEDRPPEGGRSSDRLAD